MQELIQGNDDIWGSEPILFPEEPLKKKLLRNGFRLYFFSFIVAPTGYIIKVIASRELAVADIGIFYSVLGIISLLSNYSDLGLTEALQYYLPHYFIDKQFGKAKAMLRFVLRSQIVSSLIIIAILLFVAPWLAANYFRSDLALPLMQLFCIYFLVINIFQMIQSLFIATQKVKRSQWIEWVRMWSIVLFVILGWQLDVFSLNLFMIYRLAGLVISTVIGYLIMRKHFRWLDEHKAVKEKWLVKKRMSYAIWVIIGTNATILLTQVDQQFALYFFGAENAGYRTNYLTLFNSVTIICTPLIWYLFPLLNELNKKREKEKIRILNSMLYVWFIVLALLIGAIGHFRWPELAVLLFGEKFRTSGELFQQWAWFLWLVPVMWILFQNLASRGQVRTRVYILLGGLAVNIVANYIFKDIYGLPGLIYGTALGFLAIILVSAAERYFALRREAKHS